MKVSSTLSMTPTSLDRDTLVVVLASISHSWESLKLARYVDMSQGELVL